MKLRERLEQGLRWPGWRRWAPAAGSFVAHVFLGMAVFSMLAATARPSRVVVPLPSSLEVTLVAETAAPPPGRRPTPPDAQKARPRSESLPDAADTQPIAKDPRKDQKKQGALRPDIAGGTPLDDKGGVYLGDAAMADSGAPLGLRSLMEEDPCKPKKGLPRGDCGPRWAEKFASNNVQILPTEAQLRRMYPGIIPPCPYKVGCDAGEWRSSIGTRSVAGRDGAAGRMYYGNAMNAGAAGLGGIHDIVPRLPFNPDHVDPGFGD